jgi:hypothetical protein
MLDNDMSLRDISIEYDKIYSEMQELLNEYQPCRGYHGEPCIRVGFCCQGCKHLSETGCTVKSMWCKFWLCASATAGLSTKFLTGRAALQKRFYKLPFSTWLEGRYSKAQYIRALVRLRHRRKRVAARKLRMSETNATCTHCSR